jgi:cell division protein FtsN
VDPAWRVASDVTLPGAATLSLLSVLLATSTVLVSGTGVQNHHLATVTPSVAVPVVGGGCPVLPSGQQHTSTGEITATNSKPVGNAKNGVAVSSGQTVFYAGPAPKSLDSANSKHKTSSQSPPAPSSSVVTHAGGDVVSTATSASASHTVHTTSKKARMWTVQVASFETVNQAQALQQTLCQKGYDARIIGSTRPFTVQVGAYPSSDSAMVVARHLTSRDLTVFVTLAKP